MLVYGAGLMEETGTLQRGQQTSQIMVGEIKNLSPQTLVQMESGMITMEIQLHNLYVSIIQVQNIHAVTKYLSSQCS